MYFNQVNAFTDQLFQWN